MKIRFSAPQRAAISGHMAIDMHFHSGYSHDCSTKIADIIAMARKMGIKVALTDHNTIAGVRAGVKLAPDVIMPAVEITSKEGKDIIPYFYTFEELEAFFDGFVKPRLKKKSSLRSSSTPIPMAEIMEELRKHRCVVVLPHPFGMAQRRSYPLFSRHDEWLERVDAIEVINQALLHRQNLAALGWAVELGKPGVGGTDGHIAKALGKALTISKAKTWEEFLDNIRDGKVSVFGEERRLHRQVGQTAISGARLLREKAKVIRNHRIKRD